MDTLVLIDTGADSTVLPFAFASLLGFSTSELESRDTNAVGGKTKTWFCKTEHGVDIDIGGHWLGLPALLFAENTPALMGRDIVFANFDLRMSEGETELRRKK